MIAARILTVVTFMVAASLSDAAHAVVTIREVSVDGQAIDVPPDQPGDASPHVRIPSTARTLSITFDESLPAAADSVTAPFPQPARLRYRLDGVDTAWRDVAAAGQVKLLFQDAEGGTVGGTEVTITGESAGWTGSAEESPLMSGSMSAVVPPLTAIARINVISHAFGSTVGVIGIDDVLLEIQRADGGTTQRVALDIDLGDQPFDPTMVPRQWAKSGTKYAMSRLGQHRLPTPHPILLIVDDEPERYGGWYRGREVAVEPGDTVTATWSAAWSLGGGGRPTATYDRLAAGTYFFRVGAFFPNGEPANAETSLVVDVYVPWHLRRDVWAGAGVVGLATLVTAVRSASIRRMKRRLAEIEREHALERERTRIARDLHDDVGAGLTEIAMKAEWVRDEIEATANAEALGLTDEIRSSAHSLVRGIDAIVWAVNPANDTLERFAAYLVQSTEQFLEAAGIEMRFDIPAELPPGTLTGAVRHRLFLAAREAVHNAVKHADATAVGISLAVDAGRLVLTVEDDGRGFDLAAAGDTPGHDGLDNMQKRLAEIDGICEITTAPGRGTRVTFSVPLAAALPGKTVHA